MSSGIFAGSTTPKASTRTYSPPTPSRLIATTNRPDTAPPRSAIWSARFRLVRAALAVRMFARIETNIPMIAGDARTQRAEHERERCPGREDQLAGLARMRRPEVGIEDEDQRREHDAQGHDGPVLAPEERISALLDRVRDLSHLRSAVVLLQHPLGESHGDDQGGKTQPRASGISMW